MINGGPPNGPRWQLLLSVVEEEEDKQNNATRIVVIVICFCRRKAIVLPNDRNSSLTVTFSHHRRRSEAIKFNSNSVRCEVVDSAFVDVESNRSAQGDEALYWHVRPGIFGFGLERLGGPLQWPQPPTISSSLSVG
jgi:hypothetical protein